MEDLSPSEYDDLGGRRLLDFLVLCVSLVHVFLSEPAILFDSHSAYSNILSPYGLFFCAFVGWSDLLFDAHTGHKNT